jgi:hypothetical protein
MAFASEGGREFMLGERAEGWLLTELLLLTLIRPKYCGAAIFAIFILYG